jgi:outer membrane protein assembly factor BamA
MRWATRKEFRGGFARHGKCIHARVPEYSRRIVACFACISTFWCTSAFATDPLNSNNRPNEEHQSITEPPDARANDDDATDTDFNLVPVLGGSTDLGFGGGYFAGVARTKKGYDPFLWNIDSSALITFKYTASGGFTVPYQDIYARLTIPRLFGAPLRLEIRPSYTWETIDYYGLGNASSTLVPPNSPRGYFSYERGHPQFDVDVRGKITDHLAGRVGIRYVQNFIKVAADSKLAEDERTGTDEVKRLLGPLRSHAVALFKYGLQWDTRDNETSSHSGSFDALDLKLSPGGSYEFPYRYGEATLNLRGFVPLSKPALTLAVRAVGDWMFGSVPFYELARFDDTFAIGGTNGVRGVPAQRYYGKLKAFGNIELRAELFTFRALGKPVIFGLVPFFDAGRLWADSNPQPGLDGRGVGLKYGTGAGVRLQSGASFVIRADVAWSPDATPISGYFSAGQMF